MPHLFETKAHRLRNLQVATIIALLIGAYFLRQFFAVIVFAAIVAYLCNPIFHRLKRHLKNSGLAAGLTLIISFIIVVVPLSLLTVLTIAQVQGLLHNLSSFKTVDIGKLGNDFLDSINQFIASIPGAQPITVSSVSAQVRSAVGTVGNSLLGILTSFAGSIPSLITNAVLYIYIFTAFLTSQHSLIAMIKKLNPLGSRVSDMYLSRIGDMTKAMVKGQLTIAILQGLVTALSFLAVGWHQVFFLVWMVAAVLSIIPLGCGILVIPVAAVAIATGNIHEGIIVLLVYILITTNVDNVLRPRLVPKTTQLNPALTLLAIFAGTTTFGFLGFIIGPVLMILVLSTIRLYADIVPQID